MEQGYIPMVGQLVCYKGYRPNRPESWNFVMKVENLKAGVGYCNNPLCSDVINTNECEGIKITGDVLKAAGFFKECDDPQSWVYTVGEEQSISDANHSQMICRMYIDHEGRAQIGGERIDFLHQLQYFIRYKLYKEDQIADHSEEVEGVLNR